MRYDCGRTCQVEVTYAEDRDYDYLARRDRYVQPDVLRGKIERNEIVVIRDNDRPLGWLRYGYLWDEIPFMYMLYIEEENRRQGLGRGLVEFWENEMTERHHDMVMTSSLSNEQAQHFYRTLGYRDCGALLLPAEALEIVFVKIIGKARSEDTR